LPAAGLTPPAGPECHFRPSPAAALTSSALVLPALAPAEVSREELFQRDAVHQMVEGPAGGYVADDRDTPARRHVGEEAAHPMYRLPPALAAGYGRSRQRDRCACSSAAGIP
jgi:hypothetical protein